MAETDILNPQTGYWPALGDNPNPSYGFTRKTNANSLLAKTRLGSWYQRDNANSGYAFPMSFMLRPWTTMLRLKQFYEIGKNGYFTYIDYDGGGRHHVGRFTTEPNPVQMQNAKYNCQNLIFEEIPQARMLSYPSDYGDWGKNIYAVDDFLRQTAAYQGGWELQQNPVYSAAATVPSSYEMYDAAPTSTDFIQVQYVGWGFQLNMRIAENLGICDIYVDGTLAVYGLDLSTGAAADLYGYAMTAPAGAAVLAPPILTVGLVATGVVILTPVSDPPIHFPSSLGGDLVPFSPTTGFYQVSVTMYAMPLDSHRAKIVARGAKNASATGTGVAYGGIQVIV